MQQQPESATIGQDIPTMTWRGAGSGPRPAIVSVHGGDGHKRDLSQDVVEYVTERGVTLVTIDAFMHGDRTPLSCDLAAAGPFGQLQFLDIVGHTARDLQTVVARLQADQAINSERIGLRGGSMGGYIVLAAAGLGVPVHAVLSVCGGADYGQVWPWIFRNQPEKFEKIVGVMDAITAWAEQFDPMHRVDHFSPHCLLMIHGECDPLVPIHCARTLYNALAPLYAEHPEDCLFVTHAGDHGTPNVLEQFGWDWLVRQVSLGMKLP